MDAQFKEKWIAALRSGDYQQSRLGLCREGGYCCLGVAADLLVKEGVGEWRMARNALSQKRGYVVNGEENRSWLHDSVKRRIGLTDRDEGQVMGLNDDYGKSFAEIADYIEKEL